MKKHLLFLFAALLPLVASAQTKVEIDGIWYNLVSKAKQAEVTRAGGTKYSGSITIPATVTYDGVTYSVTSIGDDAFAACSRLTAITLPEGVTSIGEIAFAYCRSLTAITLPEGLTSIGYSAFYDCSSLTSITLPVGVTSIGGNAFEGCSSLERVTINCANVDNWLKGNSSIKEIILGESVTSIGERAFADCINLTAIVVAEGNKVYDSRGGCNAIIETSTNTLLQGCSSTIIPESVTSIGNYAFYGCSSLTAINIPESVTSIGNSAFYNCSRLTAITLPENSKLTSIGDDAFAACSRLTAITLPDGVTSIGSGAFYGCSRLTAITLPDGLTSIGIKAFAGCSSLTAINIPEGVTSIGSYAFEGCSSLTAINIPEGVTSIEDEVFDGCRSLTTINIPESVTSIGEAVFRDCSRLTAINIPEGVTSIGFQTFYGCTSLTAIAIPEGVTSIGKSAFSRCSSLKELVLGKGLKKIAVDAFSTCEAIEKITIHATQPPRIEGEGNALFSDATYENATLYVPQGSISKYQVMTGWSGFYNISEIEGGTPDYLTLRQADNGEIGITVDLGRTYKVRITPSAGWKIHTVTFDGKDMTAQLADDNTFTTPTINGSAVLNVAYVKEGSAIAAATASRIKVQGHQGIISITGTTEGAAIGLYTTSGTLVATATAEGDTTHLTVPTGQVYIVKVADTVVKIGM